MTRDHVADVVDRWAELLPDLDLTGMAVLGRVYRLTRLLGLRQAAVYRTHGLHPGDVDVLAPLYRTEEGLRPRELRRAMMIGSGTLTPRVDRLEAAGLLERRSDPTDRRGRVLHLTAEGARLVPTVVAALLDVENDVLAVLPPEDRRRLAADLGAVLATAERSVDGGGSTEGS
jgi:DNA-binding MarR family transcriptional regulator